MTALRDTNLRRLATRAAGLSPESLIALTRVMERFRQLQELEGIE